MVDIVSGVVLILGGLAAFGPQWIAIGLRRSSFGVNHTYLSLAWLTNLATLANGVILKWPTLSCCWREDHVPLTRCLALQLPLIQLGLPGLYGFVSQTLYIWYCVETPGLSFGEAERRRNRAKAIFAAGCLFVLVVGVSSVVMFWYADLSADTLDAWARALGYSAAAITCVQLLPQLLETYRLRRAGSLSVVSIVVLGFGNVLVFSYQVFGNHTALSTSFANAIGAVELLGLLAMLGYFRVVDKRRRARSSLSLVTEAEVRTDERTSLILPINQ